MHAQVLASFGATVLRGRGVPGCACTVLEVYTYGRRPVTWRAVRNADVARHVEHWLLTRDAALDLGA